MLLSLIIMPYRGETLKRGAGLEGAARPPRITHEQRIRDAVVQRAGDADLGILGVSNRHELFHLILRTDDVSSTVDFSGLAGSSWIAGRIRLLKSGIATAGYQKSSKRCFDSFQQRGGLTAQPDMSSLAQGVLDANLLNRLALITEHGHVNIVLTADARTAARASR